MAIFLLEGSIPFCSKFLQRYQINLLQSDLPPIRVFQCSTLLGVFRLNLTISLKRFWGVYTRIYYLVPAHHKNVFWVVYHPAYASNDLSRVLAYQEVVVSLCWLCLRAECLVYKLKCKIHLSHCWWKRSETLMCLRYVVYASQKYKRVVKITFSEISIFVIKEMLQSHNSLFSSFLNTWFARSMQ